MIRLHVLPEMWDVNPSPFCLKAETYCRLAEVPFETVSTLPFKAPRGTLPFMTDGSTVVPDSSLIVDYLKRTRGDPLDEGLSPEQVATGHLLRRLCEQSLVFVLVYSRWVDPAGWQVIRPAFFGSMPAVVREVVPAMARRGARRKVNAQGYGKHTPDEVYRFGAADLTALAEHFKRSQFAVSDRPTSYDASVYGVLANIVSVPVETPLKTEAMRHAELTDYVGRMRAVLASR